MMRGSPWLNAATITAHTSQTAQLGSKALIIRAAIAAMIKGHALAERVARLMVMVVVRGG